MYTTAVVRVPPPRPPSLSAHVVSCISSQIVGALGVTYAAVPLYRAFCAATGFAGTPMVGTGRFEPERLVPVENARRIKVHFNADSSDQLPWSFSPQQKFVNVLPGETSLAFYKARNTSKEDIIGIATYNVTPDRVSGFASAGRRHAADGERRRSRRTLRRWSVSALRSRNCSPARKWTCPSCFSSTKTSWMIPTAAVLTTLSSRTPSSGEHRSVITCLPQSLIRFPQSTAERERSPGARCI